jgi:phosphatidylethanolamine/phosphatidyl-N-methylethanolamine N-methyltransferase
MNGTSRDVTAGRLPGGSKVTVNLIQHGYHRFAPLYDIFFGASLQPGRRIALAALDCRPGDRILEVCVGSGLSLPLFPPYVRVTGIDISRDMLAKAARRVRTRRLSQVEGVLQMDAEHMGFADASFDKAAVMYAISGLPDPARGMREIQRVCRPGATIVIANHFRSPRPLLRFCERLLSPMYRLLQYRPDLDLEEFIAEARLDVVKARRANLFGYATVLVCRNRVTADSARPSPSNHPGKSGSHG